VSTDKGDEQRFSFVSVDPLNKYAILKVDKPTTYLIVLSPNGSKADYSFDLKPLSLK
jgi:hypothetical protein